MDPFPPVAESAHVNVVVPLATVFHDFATPAAVGEDIPDEAEMARAAAYEEGVAAGRAEAEHETGIDSQDHSHHFLTFLTSIRDEAGVSAMAAMIIAYVMFDALYMLVAYAMADKRSKARLRGAWWIFAFLPVFRYITFWFRVGGFLEVLLEPPQWKVRSPWVQTMDGLIQLRVSTVSLLSQMLSSRVVSVFVNILKGI